jgi:hypothetical protein
MALFCEIFRMFIEKSIIYQHVGAFLSVPRDEEPQADAGGRGSAVAAALILGVPGAGGGRPGEQQPPAAPHLPPDWADLRPPRAPLHRRRLDDRPRHP